MKISMPRLGRLLLSMVYESLLLIAVLFVASYIFHLAFHDPNSIFFKPVHQLYLLLVMGAYFTWFWTHGGQTLAMQTWKLRITTTTGEGINLKQAIARYLFAVVGIALFGSGIFWALFDRDHQFLHDRLAGTRIVNVTG
jgi:uncharacterized RDD family membrane protein YckC